VEEMKVLAGKSEASRPLGTPRHRWDDNIKMELNGIDLKDVNWINFSQGKD
jgi:hypothetical protein